VDPGRFNGTYRVLDSPGQLPPLAAHSDTFDRNSVFGIVIRVRPGSGSQPQRTNGVCIWSTICCTVLWPFRLGSFSNSQSCRSVKPSQIIGIEDGGSSHSGAPGGEYRDAEL
jgi:hypothetical protein